MNTKYVHDAKVWDGRKLIPAGTPFDYAGKPGRSWKTVKVPSAEQGIPDEVKSPDIPISAPSFEPTEDTSTTQAVVGEIVAENVARPRGRPRKV